MIVLAASALSGAGAVLMKKLRGGSAAATVAAPRDPDASGKALALALALALAKQEAVRN
jgi:hypothetical protein